MFVDPTGNRAKGGLRGDEPVWRLATVWSRSIDASYSSNEKLEFKGLPVPQPGEILELGRSVPVGKSTFQSIFLAGRGNCVWSDNTLATTTPPFVQTNVFASDVKVQSLFQFRRVAVVVCLTNLPLGGAVGFRSLDDKGRQFRISVRSDEALRSIELDVAEDARSIDLEIIPQQPIFVEFDFAKPPPVPPLPEELIQRLMKRPGH
jgi:hypothetical protein